MCRWAGNGRSPSDGVRRGLLRGCEGSRCSGSTSAAVLYLPGDTAFLGRFRRRGVAPFGATAFRNRTRLLVALERRGSGRLSDSERLHEPLGGRGEDLQDVAALLSRGRDDRPEERENLRALEGPEAAGDLHLDLHHPQILFGEVVGEGHVEVGEETQRF